MNATEDSSLCNSAPMNLLSARDRLHLEQGEGLLVDCSVGTKKGTGSKAIGADQGKAGKA